MKITRREFLRAAAGMAVVLGLGHWALDRYCRFKDKQISDYYTYELERFTAG